MVDASDVMAEPRFVDEEQSVERAAEILCGEENTLIVGDADSFSGEVHESHLLKVLIPENMIDEEDVVGILGFSYDTDYVADSVSDVMNKHQVTVSPDTSVGRVAFVMNKEGLRSVPVVRDTDQKVVGVVHENDLMGEIGSGSGS